MSKRLSNTRKEKVVTAASSTSEVEAPATSLHRCSFFPYQPAGIKHVASSPAGCLPQVAVVRATEPTTLEIYTPSSDWAVERVIYGRAGENFECAAFVGAVADFDEMDVDSEDEIDISSAIAKNAKVEVETTKFKRDTSKLNAKHLLPFSESDKLQRARLFTAGVDGRVREWSNGGDDTAQSVELFSVDVNGGAIWSLAVSPDQGTLAIGCEDGRIRLFSIYDRSIEFLRGFEAIEASTTSTSARILSLSWNPQGDALVSGSASGSIKLWNCQTGRPVHSIKLAGVSVWSVAFCDSQSFATGDAKGRLQFWDVASGTLLQSFPAFRADVLSVVALQGRVFATGVDHKVVQFVQVAAPNAVGHLSDKWIQGGIRYFHTHDVRSLATVSIKYQKESEFFERQVLISGGVDCTLVVSDPDAFDRAQEKESKAFNAHQRRLLTFSRHSPMIQMARDSPVLAGRIGNTIQIWKLAESKTDAPVHLADLKISRYEPITSFAISPSGEFVCILTSSEFKLFRITEDSKVTRIESVPTLKVSKKSTFPHLALFSSNQSVHLFNSKEVLNLTICAGDSICQSESTILNFSVRRAAMNKESLMILSTDRQVYNLKSLKMIYESAYPITSIAL